ncbi:MAG: hypothetical protein MAGBODY4_01566 [Candidatus Marinimicrobia bacterium]|nr:hypothetical protein [Candidatus Neomarinimicrobiota bacterium]
MRFFPFAMLFLFINLIGMLPTNAQETAKEQGWNNKWGSDLTVAHNSYDNWSKGGQNNLNLNWYNDMRFVYTQGKSTWRTTNFYTLEYTRINQQEIQKTDDRLDFESMYSFAIKPPVDPYAAFTLKTQLLPGYEYDKEEGENTFQNSAFFDPGYLTQSVGFSHAHEDILNTRMGFSVKETFALKYAKDELDDSTTSVKVEPGLEFVTDYAQTYREIVDVNSKLELFSDLKGYKSIDVLWKNYLAVRLRENIVLQFQFTIWYDQDIDEMRQIKETTTLGLHYAFF